MVAVIRATPFLLFAAGVATALMGAWDAATYFTVASIAVAKATS